MALLGSNGAGKTTTLNAIAGIVPVSQGYGRVRRRATSPACRPMPSCARGWRCRPRAGGCSPSRASRTTCCWAPRRLPDRTRIPRLLERVYAVFPRLAERRHQRAGTMSGGERQMLAVGRALMSEPQLLHARRAEPRPGAGDRRHDVRHASPRFTRRARPSCSPSSRSTSRSRRPTMPTCCRSAAPCSRGRPRRWRDNPDVQTHLSRNGVSASLQASRWRARSA